MKRADLVIVAAPGDYGKPRPAIVVQSDALSAADSVLVALLTSTITDASHYRLTVEPSPTNGLNSVSQVMIDKVLAYPRAKCGPVIGRLSADHVRALNAKLSIMIGIAD